MAACVVIEELREEIVDSLEPPPDARLHRRWSTPEEVYAYNVGVNDGNAASTRLLIGCVHPIRLVEDPSLPRGVAELRVSSLDDVRAPRYTFDLLARSDL